MSYTQCCLFCQIHRLCTAFFCKVGEVFCQTLKLIYIYIIFKLAYKEQYSYLSSCLPSPLDSFLPPKKLPSASMSHELLSSLSVFSTLKISSCSLLVPYTYTNIFTHISKSVYERKRAAFVYIFFFRHFSSIHLQFLTNCHDFRSQG